MVYEAYLGMGFFRTLLIIALAFYSIRFISRLLTKKSKPTNNSSKSNDNNKKGNDDDLGEYVDFEEVKD